jgi:MscS family membrane protein
MPKWHDINTFLIHYGGHTLRNWLVVVAAFAVMGLIAALFVRYVLTRILLRLAAHTQTRLDDRLVAATSMPLAILTFFGCIHAGLHVPRLPARLHEMLLDSNAVAIALITALLLWRALDVLFDELMAPWAEHHKPPINPQVVTITRAVTKWTAVAFLAITALHRAGFDVVSVITGLGIGGVAVAFAAQETLGNILGALQIMTDQPFVVGDVVKVDNDFSGRVVSTGLRSTRLVTTSGVQIIVPNKKIAAAVLQNFSHANGLVKDVTFQLDRLASAEQLRQAKTIAEDVLRAEPRIAKDFSVSVSAFGDWSSNMRVIYYVAKLDDSTATAHDVLLAIREKLQEAGIMLAAPTYVQSAR